MAVGIVIRQRATMSVPSEDGVSAVMVTTLLRSPVWWAGTGAAVLGYVFQALALIKGSLILVQPILVSALLFALPLSARLAGRRVTRGEWLWAGVLTIGLAVFVLLARPGPKDSLASLPVAAVVTKINMHIAGERGVLALLATPAPYALVVLGVIATLLQQSAFHAGALQTSVPTMLVLEPVVAVLLGALVLGEELEAGRYEAIALAVAVAAMTAATVALGRDEGAYEAELEMKIARRAA